MQAVMQSFALHTDVFLQVAKRRELRLIENQHLLKDAPVKHQAEHIGS